MSIGDIERRLRRLERALKERQSAPDYRELLAANERTAKRVIAKMGGPPVSFEDSEELAARDAELLDRYDNDEGEAERIKGKLMEFAERQWAGTGETI